MRPDPATWQHDNPLARVSKRNVGRQGAAHGILGITLNCRGRAPRKLPPSARSLERTTGTTIATTSSGGHFGEDLTRAGRSRRPSSGDGLESRAVELDRKSVVSGKSGEHWCRRI